MGDTNTAAAAAGLSDAIDVESVEEPTEPKVVEVDTSSPMIEPGDAAVPEGAEIHHLPVRREPDLSSAGYLPVREELAGIAAMAVTLAKSNLVPYALKDKPADVMLVLLTGRELGVSMTSALRTFYVINGAVTVAPKTRMAMVHRQGLGQVFCHQLPRTIQDPTTGEPVDVVCPCGVPSAVGTDDDPDCRTWHAIRNDARGIVYSATYTTAMAGAVKFVEWEGSGDSRRKAEKSLLDKDNWKNYPGQMCQWRAIGYVLDQAFPEVGTGLYSPEEMGGVVDEDGEPILDVDSYETIVPHDTSPAAEAQRRRDEEKANRAPDPPASPDTIATFKTRIEEFRKYEGAVETLGALWRGYRGEGRDPGVPLPKVEDLLYKQCQQATALIAQIERRIQNGEFKQIESDAHVVDPEPPASGDQDPGDDPSDPSQDPLEGSETSSDPEGRVITPENPSGDVQTGDDSGGDPGESTRIPDLIIDVENLPTGQMSPAEDLLWVEAASTVDPGGTRELIDEVASGVQEIKTEDLIGVMKLLDLSASGLNESTKRARIAARRVRIQIQKRAGVV